MINLSEIFQFFKRNQDSKDVQTKNATNVAELRLDVLQDALLKYALSHEYEFSKTQPHIKLGDTAILNYYELQYQSKNKWDSGIYVLETHPDLVSNKPIKVKITDVFIAKGLVHAYIESIIDYVSNNIKDNPHLNPDTIINYPSKLIRCFDEYVSKNLKVDIFNKFGFYWCAHFEIIDRPDIKFSYGLNTGSFLKADSELGKITNDLWLANDKARKKFKDSKIELINTEKYTRSEINRINSQFQ